MRSFGRRGGCAVVAAGLLMLPRVLGALPFGIQSDDADIASSFATAMVYDPLIERVYITGSSYGGFFDLGFPHKTKLGNRDCFLASVQLPTEADARGPLWLLRESYGKRSTSEACTAIHLYRRDNGRAQLVVGHSSGSTGILEAPKADGSTDTGTYDGRIFGMLLDSTVSGHLSEGLRLESDTVEIPLSMRGAVDGSGDVFVSRIHSSDGYPGSQYSAWLENQHTIQPDPDIRGTFLLPALSSNYSASLTRLSPVQKISGSGVDNTLELVWERELGHIGEKLAVVTDVNIYSNTTVLVTGFRDTSAAAIESFVSSIDAGTGEIGGTVRITTAVDSVDDRASAMCAQTGSRYAYIAGTTHSSPQAGISSQAFLVKLDVETMTALWSTELKGLAKSASQYSSASVYGLGCAVAMEDEFVFLAGSVKDSASLSLDGITSITRSAGGDDVFVAKIDATNGDILWVRQVGTTNDDTLATGNGIVVDKNGNAILLANTRGSFMRLKKEFGERITNDIVVFSVNKEEGQHLPINEATASTSDPEQARSRAPTASTGIPENAVSSSSDSSSHTELNDFQPPTNDDVMWSYPKASRSRGQYDSKILVAIIIVTIMLLASFYGLWWVRRQRRCHRQQPLRDKAYTMDMETRSFASGDAFSTQSKKYGLCRDSLLVFEPEVVNYRSQPTCKSPGALNDAHISPHSHINTKDSMEAEVERLLNERKRQRGHASDLQGLYI